MQILESLPALRQFVQENRKAGRSISFVPTMGALHEGHLTLVREGFSRADICIPYIFVNPKQFAPTEDLASYPRTLEADLNKLRSVNASAVYLPRLEDVYPDGFMTSVSVGGISLPLEGEFRPHFFQGVATIVAKMLLQCLPDIALFGEKDYQQLMVIRTMVRDLNMPIDIIGVPTARDENGLALSSRNAYLTESQLKIAITLNKVMKDLGADLRAAKNTESIPALESAAREKLLSAGFDKIDYITVRDADTLLPPGPDAQSLRILAAAWIGKTRLIDNMAV